jgi:hypothetical protein
MGANRFRIAIPRHLDFYREGRLLHDAMRARVDSGAATR